MTERREPAALARRSAGAGGSVVVTLEIERPPIDLDSADLLASIRHESANTTEFRAWSGSTWS